MYKSVVKLSFSIVLIILLYGCSSKKKQDNNLIGAWQLSEWHIDQGFDINGDGVKSANLLKEIHCPNKEVLIFEPHNVVLFNATFNPIINVLSTVNAPSTYDFNVDCDEQGGISHATSYSFEGGHLRLGDKDVKLENNKISIIYKDKIKVYSQDSTEVIETKDLIVIYTKRD